MFGGTNSASPTSIRKDELCESGDAEAARGRLEVLQDFPLLDITHDVDELAAALVESLALPARAVSDAAHIAVSAVRGIHFLLTWNCAHVANAEMVPGIREACRTQGFSAPVICTPEELMGHTVVTWKDEIVEEVRKAREELAACKNFDLKAVLADARKRQNESGRRVISFVSKPKRIG